MSGCCDPRGCNELELLGQGASRTTNLELVDAYDTEATDLAETAGMRDRVTRRQVDIAGHAGRSRGARHRRAAPGRPSCCSPVVPAGTDCDLTTR
jgi:hypothetical protein